MWFQEEILCCAAALHGESKDAVPGAESCNGRPNCSDDTGEVRADGYGESRELVCDSRCGKATDLTVSRMRNVPAARAMSPTPRETAFTRTRMSSSPVMVGMGRVRCSNLAGPEKADTPTARIVGCVMAS